MAPYMLIQAPFAKNLTYEVEMYILMDEFEAAIKKLIESKATKIEQISAEVLKALDDKSLKILLSLSHKI